LGEDTADTLSLVDLAVRPDVDITIITPAGSPGVLHNEGFEETDLLVADSQDGVVEVGTATGLEDTGAVELEGVLIGFDEDRDGTVDEGSLKFVGAVGSDERVSTSDLSGLALVVVAVTVFGSVGVVRFEFKTVLGGVLNSEVWPATVATFVGVSVTVDDLLFREGEELAVVEEVEAFDDTGSGEGPA